MCKTVVAYICILFSDTGPDVVVQNITTLEDCLAIAQAYQSEGQGRRARCIEVRKND